MKLLAKRHRMIAALAAGAVFLVALVAITAAVGVLEGWIAALVLVAVALVLAWLAGRTRKWVPRHTILELDLERGVVEQRSPGPGRLLAGNALRLRDVVEALERAAGDDRVDALVARLGGSGLGLAQAQELRDAVAAFRAAGKRAVAYAETFGEGASAAPDYYLAAAFEQVYLQPAGNVGLTGMVSRVQFLRGVFDKLGVRPEVDHREQYKSAKNRLTETGFTEPHRESVNSILDSQFDAIVTGIAADRGLDPVAVRAAIDSGPLLSVEAVTAGLVDEVAYRDEVYDRLQETGGKPLYLATYLKRAGRPHRKGARIGLIYATGAVTRGSSRFAVFPAVGQTMGSDTVAAAFRAAVRDAKVKAIVCRVDSRGGSAVASDVIMREVTRARAAGKPVIMTMGDYAASGGYYIAAGADRIVAQPGTITGSIGVVSGKLVTADALRRVGVTYDHAARGENAQFWSSEFEYTEQGRARLAATLDDVYDRFVGHVAEGRGMEVARARELAKGRVWTGAQAKEHGLVDELGGVATALRLAKELAGVEESAQVKLVEFPKRQRRLPGQGPHSSEAARLLRLVAPLADAVAAAVPQGELVLPAGY